MLLIILILQVIQGSMNFHNNPLRVKNELLFMVIHLRHLGYYYYHFKSAMIDFL